MPDDESDTQHGTDAESVGDVDHDIYTTEDVGKQYRETVYRDLDYESLDVAPATADYPDSSEGGYRLADLPKVPKVRHIVGPSAIMLGASLGSGETMFWPTIVADYGWALYWAFWIGVITQFFINTELQRWTMATGESIFRAFERLNGIWPWFFLAAGFFHLGWPGWAAGGAEVLAAWTGIVPRGDWWMIGVVTMLLIWASYMAGPVMYNVIENIQLALMAVAIFGAVVLVFAVGTVGQLANVPAGAVNFGALPPQNEMNIAVFLGGLAYAGAGGYINLSQGVWAREKGYGMGTYQGRIKNPLRGATPETVHDGFAFEPTDKNLKRWRGWWKVTQREHFLTFVIGLLVVATVAMTIAAEFATSVPGGDGIAMWVDVVIPNLPGGALVGNLMYAVIFIALFSTQYAIVESFVRNSVDILYEGYGRDAGWDLSRTFLGLLTLFTAWGILIIVGTGLLNWGQPWILLVIGAAIAGVMMWPYNALTIILNTTRLPEHTQPGWGRVVAMWWATGFFGYFSVLLIGSQLVSVTGSATFETTLGVVGSGVGGYALWAIALIVQVYTMYRSATAKLEASGTVEDAEKASSLLS
ncbi:MULTISPECIES: Nramp family divalent metal transporter [unclassified Haladaptatus]|uniref:Nramp family divalent metal transporter n=1 Tax=unclassified Haladaptatus TaxID=2622732 RepID=UPI0023E8941A|nr:MULTISPECIES: Nramp family divalent metal transporter [unclassified Haladaptatus]